MISATAGKMRAPAVLVPAGEAADAAHVTALASIMQRIFSFPAMLGAVLVAGVLFAERGFDVDPDLWWHIRVGKDILATHHWPSADSYSFTVAGQPWLASEWLGEVSFAAAERVGAMRGLEALLIVLSAIIILALYSLCTVRSGNSKAGFLASAVLMGLATTNFNLRPQMLGYIFLVLTMIVLAGRVNGGRFRFCHCCFSRG